MNTDSTLAIEATALVKVFGKTRAVDGLDLAVRSGGVYGFLGPNGAGKTTTIRVLATLVPPDGGSARVFGHDVVREADAVRRRVSLTGQFASVDEDLTGHENLVLLARLLGFSWAQARSRAHRAARGVRPDRRRRSAGKDVLRRHAPTRRHRRQHPAHARPAVSGRADVRTRSAQPQPGVGHRARAGGGGHDRAADDPVSRRGRPARGSHRGDRPWQGHRRRHARPAQGLDRVPARCTCG